MMKRQQTDYIQFDSGKCKACWKCIDLCPENVFGKIIILLHKHAKIVNGGSCKGCFKCVKECVHGAIIPISEVVANN